MSGSTPCFALSSLCASTACFAYSLGGTEGCVGCTFWGELDEDTVLFATSGFDVKLSPFSELSSALDSPESMKAF